MLRISRDLHRCRIQGQNSHQKTLYNRHLGQKTNQTTFCNWKLGGKTRDVLSFLGERWVFKLQAMKTPGDHMTGWVTLQLYAEQFWRSQNEIGRVPDNPEKSATAKMQDLLRDVGMLVRKLPRCSWEMCESTEYRSAYAQIIVEGPDFIVARWRDRGTLPPRGSYVQSSCKTRLWDKEGWRCSDGRWPYMPSSSLSGLAESISDMLQPILPYSPGEHGRESTPRVSVDVNQMQGGRQEILSK